MGETELELINRCLAGDGSAFTGILETYQNRLYSFALRLLKDPHAAEEAAQEAFVKAFRGLSSYNSAYPFSSWLFRITHNVCMDVLRACNKTVSMDDEDFLDLPDTAQGVEDSVAASLDAVRIEALLASLPPLYSEVLLLAYRENMGAAEIARIIGAPEGTIKARLFRARELVKNGLRLKAEG
jgi:RNA polymerase sigma-70 factor (ECF subfamily)